MRTEVLLYPLSTLKAKIELGYTLLRIGFLDSAAIIKKLRNDRGWSQTQLARIAKLRQSRIAEYEQGRRVMSADRFLLLVRLLGGEVKL